MNTSHRIGGGGGGGGGGFVGVQGMETNPHDRDHLRELWRTASENHIADDDEYQRAKTGEKIFLDELVGELLAATPEMKLGTAERLARTSQAYKDCVERVHNLRRVASESKLAAADADRRYWEQVSTEATARAERRMG
jgi:hypothetical protein